MNTLARDNVYPTPTVADWGGTGLATVGGVLAVVLLQTDSQL